LVQKLTEAKLKEQNMKEILDGIPDNYLDQLTFEMMHDPIKLPGSDVILDRSTIKQHITLNGETNPFNNQKLTMADVINMPELKKEINDWISAKLKEKNIGQANVAFGESMMMEEDAFDENQELDENSNTMTGFGNNFNRTLDM